MKIVQIQERKIIVVVETDEYEKFTHSVYCLFSLLCFLLKIFAFGFELFFHTHRNIIPKESSKDSSSLVLKEIIPPQILDVNFGKILTKSHSTSNDQMSVKFPTRLLTSLIFFHATIKTKFIIYFTFRTRFCTLDAQEIQTHNHSCLF